MLEILSTGIRLDFCSLDRIINQAGKLGQGSLLSLQNTRLFSIVVQMRIAQVKTQLYFFLLYLSHEKDYLREDSPFLRVRETWALITEMNSPFSAVTLTSVWPLLYTLTSLILNLGQEKLMVRKMFPVYGVPQCAEMFWFTMVMNDGLYNNNKSKNRALNDKIQ